MVRKLAVVSLVPQMVALQRRGCPQPLQMDDVDATSISFSVCPLPSLSTPLCDKCVILVVLLAYNLTAFFTSLALWLVSTVTHSLTLLSIYPPRRPKKTWHCAYQLSLVLHT